MMVLLPINFNSSHFCAIPQCSSAPCAHHPCGPHLHRPLAVPLLLVPGTALLQTVLLPEGLAQHKGKLRRLPHGGAWDGLRRLEIPTQIKELKSFDKKGKKESHIPSPKGLSHSRRGACSVSHTHTQAVELSVLCSSGLSFIRWKLDGHLPGMLSSLLLSQGAGLDDLHDPS